MTRMMRVTALAAVVLTGGLGSVGCTHGDRQSGGDCYRKWADPCYPERYSHVARAEVLAPFAQQVYNGHVLNQTVYNWYFEPGSDRLTPAGIEKLDSIARTRPAPDGKLWLQTARDITVNPANEARIPEMRADLDTERAAAIQKYVATQPAFAPVNYEIYVHDPIVPGINSDMAGGAYRGSVRGYRGAITGSANIGVLGTGTDAPLTSVNVAPAAPAGGGGVAPTGP